MVADGAVSLSCSQEKKTENDSSVCPTEGEKKSIRPNNPSPNICPPKKASEWRGCEACLSRRRKTEKSSWRSTREVVTEQGEKRAMKSVADNTKMNNTMKTANKPSRKSVESSRLRGERRYTDSSSN